MADRLLQQQNLGILQEGGREESGGGGGGRIAQAGGWRLKRRAWRASAPIMELIC